MGIILGKTAGFCYGVKNAVTKAQEFVKSNKDKEIYCLGELVHNEDVKKKLEEEGLTFIENISEIISKSSNNKEKSLIIRAHGEQKSTYETLKENKIEILDLTCPNVLAIHDTVEKYVNEGYYIFFIAEKNHPEVIGTYGFCNGKCSIIENEEDISIAFDELIKQEENKILVVEQTTFRIEKYEKFVEIITKKVYDLNKEKAEKDKKISLEIRRTICNATKLRQEETLNIAKQVDYMIIIGGKKSSNTRKLYDISAQNCKNAILIQNALELQNDFSEELEKIKLLDKIGIMAGASTPKESIDEVIDSIKIN